MKRLITLATLSFFALCFLQISCGDSDDETSSAIQACNAECDHLVSVATDCGSDAANNCKQLCILVSSLSNTCQAKAEAYFDCSTQYTTESSCYGGDLPLSDPPQECLTLSEEYQTCF